MIARASNWLIAIGAITIFLGLCCMPAAAFGLRPDPSLLAVGGSIFALGTLICASGIYVKARALQAPRESESASRRSRGGCELCGTDVPVIQCRVHQLHLCATCLAQHFDPRSCSFVPPSRHAHSRSGKAMVKARGA